MTEMLERALDPRIAPAGIIGRHPNDESADFHLHTGSSRPRRRVRPLPRDQLAVPSENRVRRHDRHDVRENPTAQAPTDPGETTTFIVTQPHPLAAQLPLQDAIFFSKKFDDVALLPFEPDEQRRDDQVERKHTATIRQIDNDAVFGSYALQCADCFALFRHTHGTLLLSPPQRPRSNSQGSGPHRRRLRDYIVVVRPASQTAHAMRHAANIDDDVRCWRLRDRRSDSAPTHLPSVPVVAAPNTRDCLHEAWKRVSLL